MFLKISQNLPLAIAIKDRLGNDAKVDGIPAWALTDESLGKIEVAADGMSATLIPGDVTGACKLQVKADADLGAGVKEIVGELDIEFIGGDAVTISIAAGEPVDKA